MNQETKIQLDQAVQRLVQEFKPDKVILFGSRAWGTPDASSDYDILVVVPESQTSSIQRASRAYRCLQGLRIPAEIIVSTRKELERYRSVRASLTRKILQRGQVLYG